MKAKQSLTLLFLLLLLPLSLIPIAHSPPPSYLTVTTGEIPLGDLTDSTKFILGSYYCFDRNNPDILWVAGKKNATNDLRILKYNIASGISTVIDPGEGHNRGLQVVDDPRNVYAPSSDSGDMAVIDKILLNVTNYNPFGSGSELMLGTNLTASAYGADTKIYYVQGAAPTVHTLGYFSPTEQKFYNWTYYPQGDWTHAPAIYRDKMFILHKDGSWMGVWNWTSHTYYEYQLVGDSNYPTYYVDSLRIDEANHLLWMTYYGRGCLIKYDMLTETWQIYDVSGIAGNPIGVFLIGDYLGFYDLGAGANIYLWPPSSGPLEYGTERPNVWAYPETLSGGEHWSGGQMESPPGNTYYFITHAGSPETFWWKLAYITISPSTYIPNAVDVTSAPSQLGAMLGISAFAGGLILGVIVMAIVNIPVMMLVRGKDGAKYILLIFLFASEGIAVVIGWFPVWLMVVTILGVAGLWALAARERF